MLPGPIAPAPGFIDEKFKTELCVKFTDLGNCPYGMRCRFAHGEHELRPKLKPKAYKTKPCHNFLRTGTCAYGERCNFQHINAQGMIVPDPATILRARLGPQLNIPMPTVIRTSAAAVAAMPLPDRPPLPRMSVPSQHAPVGSGGVRQRTDPAWASTMTGLRHESGLWNLHRIHSYQVARPPVSERFQAWKEERGSGPLPEHVVVVKDNQEFRKERAQLAKLQALLSQPGSSALAVSELQKMLKEHQDRKRRRRKHRSRDRERSSRDRDRDRSSKGKERSSKRRSRSRRSRSNTGSRSGSSSSESETSSESDSSSRSRSRSRSRRCRT